MPAPEATVSVRTPGRTYDVLIGQGVLVNLGERIRRAAPNARKVVLLTDAGIADGTIVTALHDSLLKAGLHVDGAATLTLRPSETDKSLPTVQRILQTMAAANLERNDLAIVVGGGVLGDMAGFAAATYRRGIRWINCPTTLLSMVDASVGGKTGVNLRIGHELQKNMVGAFWQPSLVVADVAALASLPERVFRAGLAECIKHGFLSAPFGDAELFHWTKANLGAIGERRPEVLTELVARNVAVKAKVVGMDEREESADPDNNRALLNLGHTFGHAIETLPKVSPTADPTLAPLQHGEAVALGLVCATRCAELMKLIGDGRCESLQLALKHAGLATTAHGLPPSAEVYERMLHDKKTAGGKLRLVLPVGDGQCRFVSAPERELVLRAIDAIRA